MGAGPGESIATRTPGVRKIGGRNSPGIGPKPAEGARPPLIPRRGDGLLDAARRSYPAAFCEPIPVALGAVHRPERSGSFRRVAPFSGTERDRDHFIVSRLIFQG